MRERPLISVVIPVYKTPEEYLRSCIESVLLQTVQDFEVILVDDGSPDNCGEICDSYAKQDNRVKVIHQKNAGVSAARNAGLKVVQGKYLTFLDSDDLLVSTAWETAIQAIEEYDTDCVVFGWNDFTSDGKEAHHVTDKVSKIDAREAEFQIASDNFLCGGGYPWNKFWNAEKIRLVHGELVLFSDAVFTYEDKLWIIETLKGLDSIVLLPDILYEYRFLAMSLTQSEEAWYKRQFNAYDAYDLILDELSNRNKKAYRGAIRFYFAFCFTDLKNMYPYRKNDIQRFKDTRHRLAKLSRRIKIGDLPNYKYYLAWLFFLIFGWI